MRCPEHVMSSPELTATPLNCGIRERVGECDGMDGQGHTSLCAFVRILFGILAAHPITFRIADELLGRGFRPISKFPDICMDDICIVPPVQN
jgi:hypothetical protein